MPRPATFTELLHKPVRSKTITLHLPPSEEDPEGSVEVTVRVRAMGQKAYDDLLAAHPPTKKQRDDGDVYNVDTFCPALLAGCMVEPKVTVEEATELWTSDTWSRGELSGLFFACVDVNSKGLDIPFT